MARHSWRWRYATFPGRHVGPISSRNRLPSGGFWTRPTSLEAKFVSQKFPCLWPRRCSQIIQFVIRFATPPRRTACPVAKKAIFENRESDQSVARFANANFGLSRPCRFRATSELMHRSKFSGISTSYAAPSTRLSISMRNVPKSIGLVRSASAPFSSTRRLVSASP